MFPEIRVITPKSFTCVQAHLAFAPRGQASVSRKRGGEYSAAF